VCVEAVNRQPSCLVSSGETVKPFSLTDVPDILSTRRCNRFIRRRRRLVVIGFHSETVLSHSSPHRSGYQRSIGLVLNDCHPETARLRRLTVLASTCFNCRARRLFHIDSLVLY